MTVAVAARMAARVFTAGTFGARLHLAVAVAFLALLAPRRAHASEDRWWYLDGFGEIGITDVFPPDGGYLPVAEIGPGATALWRLVPWVHAGVGARFTMLPWNPGWGRYYILTVPVVLKFVLPLSERGHELQLGGGIGIGGYWERLDPNPNYLP